MKTSNSNMLTTFSIMTIVFAIFTAIAVIFASFSSAEARRMSLEHEAACLGVVPPAEDGPAFPNIPQYSFKVEFEGYVYDCDRSPTGVCISMLNEVFNYQWTKKDHVNGTLITALAHVHACGTNRFVVIDAYDIRILEDINHGSSTKKTR